MHCSVEAGHTDTQHQNDIAMTVQFTLLTVAELQKALQSTDNLFRSFIPVIKFVDGVMNCLHKIRVYVYPSTVYCVVFAVFGGPPLSLTCTRTVSSSFVLITIGLSAMLPFYCLFYGKIHG